MSPISQAPSISGVTIAERFLAPHCLLLTWVQLNVSSASTNYKLPEGV